MWLSTNSMSMKKDDNIHADHRKRMRVKFSKNGFTDYHSHEVLEQVLFSVLPRINTNPIGHRLVKKFGKIASVLRTPKNQLEKIEGIGPKSAEYLAEFVPKTTEMIIRQYRSVSDLSVFQIAFLADWFMRCVKDDEVGVIICNADKYFVDFKCVKYTADFSDIIAETVGEGFYYILMKDFSLETSTVYRLLDETAKRGAGMINAYILEGKRPVSVLFSE